MNKIEQALKKNISVDINIQIENNIFPTREDIPKIVERTIAKFINDPFPFSKKDIESINKEKIIDEVLSQFPTTFEELIVLEEHSSDHKEWLQNIDKKEWKFEKRFKEFISEELGYGHNVVEDIMETADKVLSKLENPKRLGAWRRQGLVFGNVQSGKTTSYSALINKATDAGYKIIVVLGGLNKNLRSQTQIALEEYYTGHKTANRMDTVTERIGVGLINEYRNLKVTTLTSRDDRGDFKKSDVERYQNINFSDDPKLFVIQKNASTLKNLLNFFMSKINQEQKIDAPILLIDDECDNGSINTKPQDDKEPTKLNGYIRAILSIFKRSSYVAYTATPFASIFINPNLSNNIIRFHGNILKDENGNTIWESKNNRLTVKRELIEKSIQDQDLFPKDFIINLPTNNNYIGAKKLFGIPNSLDESEETNPLPVVRTVEEILHYDRNLIDLEKEWIPPGHKKNHQFMYNDNEDDISPTLKYALNSFLISIAARNLRIGNLEHNTMLINVTNWNDTQQQIVDLVSKELEFLKTGINLRMPDLITELKKIWETDFIPTTQKLNNLLEKNLIDLNQTKNFQVYDWSKILEQLESKSIKKIIIHKVFGNNKDVLMYNQHRDVGLNVIAIGAIKLSRGLVLENLLISYFKRPAKQYDTLLQMGRWFGYRPNYLDLSRLFIDEILLDRFEKSAWASERLKKDFEVMARSDGTPRDWGHRVRTYPEVEQLIPTSKNKMLSATIYDLSFEGLKKQTTRWQINNDVPKKNLDSFEKLLKIIDTNKIVENKKIKKKDNYYLWKDVDSLVMKEFLNNYQSPINIEKNAKKNELIEYIENCNKVGKLKKWDIFIKGVAQRPTFNILDLKISLLKRNPFSGRSINVLKENFHYDINKEPIAEAFKNENNDKLINYFYLGGISDKDTKDIIDEKIYNEALQKTLVSWEINTRKNKSLKKPEEPSEEFIRSLMGPEKGILGFYFFDPKNSDNKIYKEFYKNISYPLVGYSISFPGDLNVTYRYVINKQKQIELGIVEEEEDAEEETI
jgi:hypothetical protein